MCPSLVAAVRPSISLGEKQPQPCATGNADAIGIPPTPVVRRTTIDRLARIKSSDAYVSRISKRFPRILSQLPVQDGGVVG